MDEKRIAELLRVKGDYLFHRESQELEFKEQFNFAGLADYFRDFAGFANNRGGILIFGVKDKPRIPIGLSDASMRQFEKIDPERISGYLLNIFSSDIRWKQSLFKIQGMTFGVFEIYEADVKPVIARKDEGKDNTIKNGEIYYRYGGRTQKIQSAELENLINRRVEQTNNQWMDLMAKIGAAGPNNAAILDTEKSLIAKGDKTIMVLDEDLAQKLKFIKEGQFSETKGATTLRLVGDVVPVNEVDVVKKVKENLTKTYPLSGMDLAQEVRKRAPKSAQHQVWAVIAENDMKANRDYSAYNFRNRTQEEQFEKAGVLAGGTPSIYNYAAVDFIVKVIDEKYN